MFSRLTQNRNGLRGIPVRRQMKTNDKACFAVYDEPDVMLDTCDFDHSFVRVPFVRIEVQQGQELQANIVKQGREFCAPVADSGVRDVDIKGNSENKADVTERIFAKVKHG
jgi:hypothetical protein